MQCITSVTNKIAPFKEIRIYSHDWLDGEILDKIILWDKKKKKFKASRLNIDEQLYKEQKTVLKLIKKKKRLLPRSVGKPRSYEKLSKPRVYDNQSLSISLKDRVKLSFDEKLIITPSRTFTLI